jgi:hypothetical protein
MRSPARTGPPSGRDSFVPETAIAVAEFGELPTSLGQANRSIHTIGDASITVIVCVGYDARKLGSSCFENCGIFLSRSFYATRDP